MRGKAVLLSFLGIFALAYVRRRIRTYMLQDQGPLSPVQLRLRAGLTQMEVAIALGKQPSTISDWERGVKRPRLSFTETLKLMVVYQCSLQELAIAFDRTDPDDLPRLE